MGVEGAGDRQQHLPLIAGKDSYSLTVTLFLSLFLANFFFFGHATWLAGPQLPDQGLNLDHGSESQNPNHLAMGNSLLQTFKIVYSSYFYFLTLHSLFNVL